MSKTKKGRESLMESINYDRESKRVFGGDKEIDAKLDWILKRAEMYAEKTGKTVDEILEAWEEGRTYWYMNYYQECNQPKLEGDNIMMFDDFCNKMKSIHGEDPKNWRFKCPSCGETQSPKDFIDAGIEEPESKTHFSCIGRWVKGRGCNWSLGGLIQINELTIIKDGKPFKSFAIAEEEVDVLT